MQACKFMYLSNRFVKNNNHQMAIESNMNYGFIFVDLRLSVVSKLFVSLYDYYYIQDKLLYYELTHCGIPQNSILDA